LSTTTHCAPKLQQRVHDWTAAEDEHAAECRAADRLGMCMSLNPSDQLIEDSTAEGS
jgi:hypothetical protein